MPNPSGANQLGTSPSVFRPEPAYGAKQQMDQLARSAQVAGAQGSTSAIQTPRRAGRRAKRGGGEAAVVRQAGAEPMAPTAPTAPAGEQRIPYSVMVRTVWAEIAGHPDASELARDFAGRAERQER